VTRILSRPPRPGRGAGSRGLPRRRAGLRAGFTLTELLVSMTLLSVVMGSVVSVITQVQRDYTRQRTRDSSMTAVRSAELLLGRVFRTAGSDPTKVGIVGITAQPNGAGSVRVRADFNPADGDVNDDLEDVTVDLVSQELRVQWKGTGAPAALVSPVSALTFEYYRRDGTQITDLAYADSAKRVRILITSPMLNRDGTTSTLRSESWAFVRND
jgi:prepilin-type N-terminal cleavage/methylation domain-containing protein